MNIYHNNQQSFQAVKLYPALEQWSPRVLNETLNSRSIKKIIYNDAKNNKDTRISFISVSNLLGNTGYEAGKRELRVKGDNKNISIKASGYYSLKNSVRAFVERASINAAIIKKLHTKDLFLSPNVKNTKLSQTVLDLQKHNIRIITDNSAVKLDKSLWENIKDSLKVNKS